MKIEDIPQGHRDVIARWLLDLASGYQPSWLLNKDQVVAIQNAFVGAAVDIADGGHEDRTVDRARDVIIRLQEGS